MHEREAFHVADPFHLSEGVANVVTVQDDSRSVAEARLDLGSHRACRHDDRDRHADRPTGPSIRLPGVPRRQGDDAPLARLRRQGRDPVRHPAGLEGPRLLQVFGLEIQALVAQRGAGRGPGPGGRRGRGQDRRAVDQAGQTVRGGPDVPDGDVEFGLGARVDLGHAAEYRTAFVRVMTASGLLACLRKH